jgi:hypothetical protein
MKWRNESEDGGMSESVIEMALINAKSKHQWQSGGEMKYRRGGEIIERNANGGENGVGSESKSRIMAA